jgi:hypothetical protein
MSEDEFDFAGQNPATHLPIDRKARPFDYAARLQKQEYTKESPPDIGGLFKALASEYVPTRVVNLPPKVVTRVHIRDIIDNITGFLIAPGCMMILMLLLYLTFVGGLGIIVPYMTFTSFEVKVHLRPGATCTVTSKHVETEESSSDSGTDYYYVPVVNFTLRTPDGKSYQAHEYSPGSYSQQSDAQQYISEFQIHQSYECWYSSINPTEASFFKVEVGFWDYFWLVFNAILFLIWGVGPNLLIMRPVGRFLIGLVRGRVEIVW